MILLSKPVSKSKCLTKIFLNKIKTIQNGLRADQSKQLTLKKENETLKNVNKFASDGCGFINYFKELGNFKLIRNLFQ